MKEPDQNKPVHCAFCGKSQFDVKLIIAGPSIGICSDCISAIKRSAPYKRALAHQALSVPFKIWNAMIKPKGNQFIACIAGAAILLTTVNLAAIIFILFKK